MPTWYPVRRLFPGLRFHPKRHLLMLGIHLPNSFNRKLRQWFHWTLLWSRLIAVRALHWTVRQKNNGATLHCAYAWPRGVTAHLEKPGNIVLRYKKRSRKEEPLKLAYGNQWYELAAFKLVSLILVALGERYSYWCRLLDSSIWWRAMIRLWGY